MGTNTSPPLPLHPPPQPLALEAKWRNMTGEKETMMERDRLKNEKTLAIDVQQRCKITVIFVSKGTGETINTIGVNRSQITSMSS